MSQAARGESIRETSRTVGMLDTTWMGDRAGMSYPMSWQRARFKYWMNERTVALHIDKRVNEMAMD